MGLALFLRAEPRPVPDSYAEPRVVAICRIIHSSRWMHAVGLCKTVRSIGNVANANGRCANMIPCAGMLARETGDDGHADALVLAIQSHGPDAIFRTDGIETKEGHPR